MTQIGVPDWCACFFVFLCVCTCTRLLTPIGFPDWCGVSVCMYVHSFTDANRRPSLFCACNRLLTQIGVPDWCACFFVFLCVCTCTRLLTQIVSRNVFTCQSVSQFVLRRQQFTDANRCPRLVCVCLCASVRMYVHPFTDANRCPKLVWCFCVYVRALAY